MEYPATIKRVTWQVKKTDRLDSLLSQQDCALFTPKVPLQIINQCGALCIGGTFSLEEISFDYFGIGILAYPFHTGRLTLIAWVQWRVTETGPAQISEIADIVGDHLLIKPGNIITDSIVSPGYFLF